MKLKFWDYEFAGPGKSFGELALINKDSIRNASVIADDNTELIVFSRELFDRSIKSVHEADLKARQDIVNTNPLFANWKPNYKRQAAMSLRREVYNFDSVVLKQGLSFKFIESIINYY